MPLEKGPFSTLFTILPEAPPAPIFCRCNKAYVLQGAGGQSDKIFELCPPPPLLCPTKKKEEGRVHVFFSSTITGISTVQHVLQGAGGQSDRIYNF